MQDKADLRLMADEAMEEILSEEIRKLPDHHPARQPSLFDPRVMGVEQAA